MTVQFDSADLAPLVEEVVIQVLQQLEAKGIGSDDRLAILEPEAATLLSINPHQLGDARRRGEITATKAGGRIAYEKSELLAYLARNRQG